MPKKSSQKLLSLSKQSLKSFVPGLALGLCLGVGSSVFANKDQGLLPLDDLRTFTEVLQRIKVAYVEPIDDQTLLENAIKGMLSGLDPHSAYLDTQDYKDLRTTTTGQYGGLGIRVDMQNGVIQVVSPIDDTPADRAGIKAGDLIIRLDETAVKGLSLDEAVNLMRGKPGSEIKLTINRPGESKPLIFNVERAVISNKSVSRRVFNDRYGYLRISQFQIKTGEELTAAIARLQKEHPQLEGYILDLRNNPGGVLSASVEVADAFLEDGLIVYTEGRMENSEFRYSANGADSIAGKPLVVLINGGSASASEIVAGALQDHRRAVVIGTNSFGKGSVQTVLQLNNQRALKLTTARYFTPAGRSIQAQGIVPDIKIARTSLAEDSAKAPIYVKEADLDGHLSAGDEKTDTSIEDAEMADLVKTDYQLYEAVNLLKGMSIMAARQVPAQ